MSASQQGFTLAEVLIALALLGVIAALAIPKVIQANNSADTMAKVKETVSTIEQAWYTAKLQDQVTYGTTNCTLDGTAGSQCSLYTTIQPNLNMVAAQGNIGLGTGCTTGLVGYVQFGNGVIVQGLVGGRSMDAVPTNGGAFKNNAVICIDVNGLAVPNKMGQDTFYGDFNAGGGFANGSAQSTTAKNFFWGDGITAGIYKQTGGTGYIDGTGTATTTATFGPVYTQLMH